MNQKVSREWVRIIRPQTVVKLKSEEGIFGEIWELTSPASRSDRTNLAIVTLWAADFLHHHKVARETYYCIEGAGEVFLKEAAEVAAKYIPFMPGDQVDINAGTVHAAKPYKGETLRFLCLSDPAFDPADVYQHPAGRKL